ncbi:MAG: 1-phosphofructokinase [Clostridia bacterium]|nr:1-phosphofructokinase [Clostridia bacterium]
MIYTVTFNPALDYVIYTDNLAIGKTNRSLKENIFFGGKGINVSVVLSRLGVCTTALGFTAGFTGEALEAYLDKENIKTDFIRLKQGNTRINVKLKGENETEINAAGPEITEADIEMLFEKLNSIKSGDVLVLSGSVPKTVKKDIYARILLFVQNKGIKTVVDAAGELLLSALKHKPFLIKPNIDELAEISGRELKSAEDISAAALKLKELGAVNVLVSMGKNGALLIDEFGGVHLKQALGGEPVNTVGAGDSMVAGFLAGCEKGYEYALRLSLASGGATACSEDLATKEQIEELLKTV